MSLRFFALAICAALFLDSTGHCQEATRDSNVPEKQNDVAKATLAEDGTFVGTIVGSNVDDGKVTIANDGVVVDSVPVTDSQFEFKSLGPGNYQIFGSSGDYAGTQSVEILPYQGVAPPMYELGVSDNISYDSFASAPAASCGACNSCGCTGVGGIGGGGGGGAFGGGNGVLTGGRGLLGNATIRRLALVGGITAIAVGDASPDD